MSPWKPCQRSANKWSSAGIFIRLSWRYICVEPNGEYSSIPPWKKHIGHVFSSNFSSGTSFTSGASPSREFGVPSPSVST